MKTVMLLLLIYLNGDGEGFHGFFNSPAECEAKKAEVVAGIAAYNAGSDPNKVTHYVLTCQPAGVAPQGIEVNVAPTGE